MASADVNLWQSPEHALDYLRRADSIPHRVEGEATLLEFLPEETHRILDLGSGGGRLLSLVRTCRSNAQFVALDVERAVRRRSSDRHHRSRFRENVAGARPVRRGRVQFCDSSRAACAQTIALQRDFRDSRARRRVLQSGARRLGHARSSPQLLESYCL